MNDGVIKKLNSFLEGTYMAIHTYEKYIYHTNDQKIKQLLQKIQQNHKQHAAMIAERIQNLGGIPVDDVGFMGHMVELVSSFKSTKDSAHILKDALVGEQRGIEKSKEILDDHLDDESFALVQRILDADEQHIDLLKKKLHTSEASLAK